MSSTQSNYCTEIVKIRPRKFVVIVHNYTLSVKFMQTFLLTKLTHWCMLLIGEWIYFVIRSISNFLSIMSVSLFKPSNNAIYRYSCALCHLSFQKKTRDVIQVVKNWNSGQFLNLNFCWCKQSLYSLYARRHI